MRRVANAVKVCALCVAVSVAAVFADTIELLSGAPIAGARVVERTPSDVKFYIAGGSVLYMVNRSQVLRIIYDNGAVEEFGKAPVAQYAPPPPPQPVAPPPPQSAPPPPPRPTPPPPSVPPPPPPSAPPPPTMAQQYAPPPSAAPMQQYVPPPQLTPEQQSAAPFAVPSQSVPEAEVAAPVYGDGAALSNDGGGVGFGVRVELGGYRTELGENGGYGASGGVNVSIPITNALSFKPGLYFTYRAPIIMLNGGTYYTDLNRIEEKVEYETSILMREFAIGVPLLMQASVTKGGGVFVEAGVDAGIPLGTTRVSNDNCYRKGLCPESTVNEKDVDVYDERTKFDLGIVAGLGLKVTGRFAVDLRSVTYLNSFSRIESLMLNQYSLGVSALFP